MIKAEEELMKMDDSYLEDDDGMEIDPVISVVSSGDDNFDQIPMELL